MTAAAHPRTLTLPAAPPPQAATIAAGGVAVWSEPLTIPTYEPGEPEQHPMFLDRRVYQGSSGRVYPLPFIDSVATEPTPRAWQAIHLENAWVRLVILPELGGRIHVGYDKVNDYDFFYRNSVIKPALVGLAGPWVSGGVEFNWPQHHRPATFLPTDTDIETHDDGSVTVWCSDHDPFARMKGMHGITLSPDSSLIELRARLHNRSDDVQTFLWWANVAARAHEEYQSFFPTDVHYVADHARRAVTAFPRADRPYYDVDYPARVSPEHPDADRIDIYSNIPVPTSYMVLETQDDFFGGYDHRADAGFVHWADRRIAPGKKQWTWGNADFGHAWDDHLTDEDGPYVELMAGVYTDNQPDFSYLAPGETKTFSQYWYPITRIGPAHQATTEAAVSLTLERGRARVGVAVTRPRTVTVSLRRVTHSAVLHEGTAELDPGHPALIDVDVASAALDELEVVVTAVGPEGDELIRWRHRPSDDIGDEPATATEPPLPDEIESLDELYLTGVHLAQYRHPTRDCEPYWEEALRRDPGDSRSAIALAARRHHAGLYDDALALLTRARERLTFRNPNPRDGEVFYRLGLVLTRLGDPSAAYDAFAKAAWDARWVGPASLRMATLDARAGRDALGLDTLARARRHDADDLRARCLEVILLRRLGRAEEALALLEQTRRLDPLDQWARALAGEQLTRDARTLLDVALDYAHCGELDDALELLTRAAHEPPTAAGNVAPVAHYARASLLDAAGRTDEAREARSAARTADARWCFPDGLDAYDALCAAIAHDDTDARALALRATWLYDRRRRVEALEGWRQALHHGGDDAGVLRNAAVATATVEGDLAAADELYARALALEPQDARLWFEADQLAARRDQSAERRRERLDSAPRSILDRNDVLVEYADLLTSTGDAARAVDLLRSRALQPWEGGEGRALAVWEHAHAVLARAALGAGDAPRAESFAADGIAPPASLGEARLVLDVPAELIALRALALDALGRRAEAAELRAGAVRAAEARSASLIDASTAWAARVARDNDDEPTCARLRAAAAGEIERLRTERARIDYFATSLPTLVLFPEEPAAIAERTAAALERSLARALGAED